MKSIRRGMAVLLAALLMMPSVPAAAAEPPQKQAKVLAGTEMAAYGERLAETKAVSASAVMTAKASADMVCFNTGSKVWSVVDRETFKEEGDACFEEDGSYTIHIPEENPFFPYEVQFTYDGEIRNEWFMTPDDSVEAGGHTFYVSANFDDTEVTQMSLHVAGDTIAVYPEEKEFTDGDGAMPFSLLPLKVKNLTVDLSAYTPAELTMISVDSIFAGNVVLGDTDKVIWTDSQFGDDYTVISSDGILDLSRSTCYGSNLYCQMIVGDVDQLAASNIRYIVNFRITASVEWLTPVVYTQEEDGTRASVTVLQEKNYYKDPVKNNRLFMISVPNREIKGKKQVYVSLGINSSVFPDVRAAGFRVYEGKFLTAQEAMAGEEITAQICSPDLSQKDTGYPVSIGKYQWVTMVTFDAADNVTGCLAFQLWVDAYDNAAYPLNLYEKNEAGQNEVVSDEEYREEYEIDDCSYVIFQLSEGYRTDVPYYLTMYYDKSGAPEGESTYSAVTAAYVGQFATIAEAKSKGAEDIKEQLIAETADGGYQADYSQGVFFTVFVGEDDNENQEVYHYNIKAVEKTPVLSSSTSVTFRSFKTPDGNSIEAYQSNMSDDSYADKNYLTVLVHDADLDLSNLAPVFSISSGAKLYAEGSSQEEVSGESYHDFSKGPVQYTVSAENKVNSKNYWIQVVRVADGEGKLYVNSLTDESAETKEENGVIYSAREIMLDNYHGKKHDILFANIGTEKIAALSVELESDVLELDDYWTLSGNYDLEAFEYTRPKDSYSELQNLAKVRLRAKDGTDRGKEVSGTLTVKSAGTPVMVLKLTGSVGDPCIITKEIPDAVKYVPYGTMIQNNNKYDWNTVSYSWSGKLPAGMVVKENGELYGVPAETGTFTFTVRMKNSYSSFSSSSMTYTLVVADNTDANVDAATDMGYDLTERVPDMEFSSISGTYLLVSQGVHDEFQYVFLDGEKLEKGQDYTSESGSTRITIQAQTLERAGAGLHTLGIEFRTKDNQTLKRAAQNYHVTVQEPDDDSDDDDNSDDSDNSEDDDNSGNSGDNGSGNHGSGSNSSGSSSPGDDNTVSNHTASSNNGNNTAANTASSSDDNKAIIFTDDSWIKDEKGWWCRKPDGSWLANTWYQLPYKGTVGWYYFNEQGYMRTGWLNRNDQWYYLNPVSDGTQGKMCTEWVCINGKWCFFKEDGSLVMNTWYQIPCGTSMEWYYFDEQGYMADGWISEQGQWYYLNPAEGGMQGKMNTGWQIIDGKWYYFNEESDGKKGALVTDAWIGKYYVDENGVWTEEN